MARQDQCIFCNSQEFPREYQVIYDFSESWLFVHNIKPHCDYHCLIVLKPQVFDIINHCSSLSDAILPDVVMKELGLLLNKACMAIKACSPEIEYVFVTALGAGAGSSHLHFHLIPKRRNEKVKTPHNPEIDGGGMFFLARKELVGDGFLDYLKQITGCKSDALRSQIDAAVKERVKDNTKLLKEKFLSLSPLPDRTKLTN